MSEDEERTTAVHHLSDDTGTGPLDATIAPPSAAGRSGARLIVLEGAHAGRHWTLGARATIGRGTRVDVTVEDSLVSREHVVVSWDDAGWLVRDLGSRNGSLLNGRRIDVERMKFGDRLTVGTTVLLLAHVDPVHERLIERQKIEALGRLGAGIAHDLNNYFGAILGAVEFLDGMEEGRSIADHEVRECLADVKAATRRGAELTQRLLAFARRGGEEHLPVDVSQLCEDAAQIARRTFDRSVRIDLAVFPGLTLRGDRGRLHHVLMNLLVNARDAMPKGGTISVRVDSVPSAPGEPNGSRVRIVVQDTGAGMDAETRERIFEPFFTTKAPDKGTGLGLAIAFDVITSHGGTITCESAVGRGTTFCMILPASDAIAPRREARTPHRPMFQKVPDQKVGSVLVVDDEPMVRRTLRRLLEREGWVVVEATDGQRAIETVRTAKSDYEVVLMDLDMPEVDGETACRAMQGLDPGLPVVILSGLCDEPRRIRLEEAGAHAVLQKPCDAATLRSVIRAAMAVRQR